jgi:hypothetical protein
MKELGIHPHEKELIVNPDANVGIAIETARGGLYECIRLSASEGGRSEGAV